jgi:hypothetical protein
MIIVKARFPEQVDVGFMMMKEAVIRFNDGAEMELTMDAFNMTENQLSGLDPDGERHRVDMTTITEIELI